MMDASGLNATEHETVQKLRDFTQLLHKHFGTWRICVKIIIIMHNYASTTTISKE